MLQGNTPNPNKYKRKIYTEQIMTPRTRYSTKSKALMQQDIQKEKMMTQEKDQGEELSFLDTQDSDVQLIEAPKKDLPNFMSAPRGNQGLQLLPSFHHGCLI